MPALVFDERDASGLICGFWLHDDRAPERVVAPPDARADASGAPVWLHFNLGDMRARNWIAACGSISGPGRDVLLGDNGHIRLVSTRSELHGVLGDLHYEFDTDPEQLVSLYLYADGRRIVTGRHDALKAVDRLREEMTACPEPVAGPFAVLSRLLGQLAETFDTVAVQLGEAVDAAEDRVLRDRHEDVGADLARVRRVLARLRRHVSANRQSLARACAALPADCGRTEADGIRAAVDRFEAIGHDLELVQDRARLLQEEIARRLNEATNRNLYVLSIVTAIFLPVTLITGVFGMNVGGMPWVDHVHGFWVIVGMMVVTLLVTLALLHWRKLF
jgi:zinc transporter